MYARKSARNIAAAQKSIVCAADSCEDKTVCVIFSGSDFRLSTQTEEAKKNLFTLLKEFLNVSSMLTCQRPIQKSVEKTLPSLLEPTGVAKSCT